MLRVVAAVLALTASCLGQWDPGDSNGKAIVHLFEWKWDDIAQECEDFLGPKGFGGVQISPPNEYVVVHKDQFIRPWWERYQPVSYWLMTRSGDESSFQNMVKTCNRVGVRIYVDAVINHMTGQWPEGTVGSGGVAFDSEAESYPGVPYTQLDFNDANCTTASGSIEDYGDANQVRNCKLVGLNDINQAGSWAQEKIINYLNMLIYYGVAGFRIDASKHIWPEELKTIFESLDDLNTDFFINNQRAFIYQEVIDLGGEAVSGAEYVINGRVTEFKYGRFLGDTFRGEHDLKSLIDFGEEWGMLDRGNALVFVDNHDNQRGHGSGGNMVLTFRDPKLYKMANAFMLAWPYGFPRIMSSYYWEEKIVEGYDENDWVGPPMDEDENIVGPTIKPDGSCDGGWICEHRWSQITNMVEFANVVYATPVTDWWDNGSNQIAFCRGTRGFIAINNDDHTLQETLQTCLEAGTYCDVISGSKNGSSCTGIEVTVGDDGTSLIEIVITEEPGVIAIHKDSKL